MLLKDSVAIVTGANRGLGRAYAQALLTAGAKVYAGARDPATVDLRGVIPIRLDVTNAEQVANVAQTCRDVNIVINNAGIAMPSTAVGEDAIEKAEAHLQTNFIGMMRVTNAFAPVLALNGGGALVNMLSVLSWFSMPTTAAYSASKSAAWALTNSVRHDLRAQGTLVIAVHSGFIDTDMTKHLPVQKASPDDIANKVLLAIEAGQEEVLTDEWSTRTKDTLSHKPGPYLSTMKL